MNAFKPETILDFWFEELTAKQWFAKDPALDADIAARFSSLHRAAIQGELFTWRTSATGRLAEIIVLDQFSRNMYRDEANAFASDPMALALAQEAVSVGSDQHLPAHQRQFLYMPYMHSESALIHDIAVSLFNQPGLERNLDFELRHKAIIDRFGRYPHRNAVLGRQSSAEELEFLQQPGSRF